MSNFKFTEAERSRIEASSDLRIDPDVFDRIEQIVNERDGWIRVEDGLPDFGEKVLVAYMPSQPLMERWDYAVTKRNDLPSTSIYARGLDENKFRVNGIVTHWKRYSSPKPTKP